jgi:integrase
VVGGAAGKPVTAVVYRRRVSTVPRPTPTIPSYRLHKASGQAVVTVRLADGGRRDVYLGEFNSDASRREYARVITELAAVPVADQVVDPTVPPDLTIDEVLVPFWTHAQKHYRRTDGTSTNELMEYRQTLKPLRHLYGKTLAKEFGPLALKAVRRAMVDQGWCRRLINARVGRVRRVFKWAASEQLVPVAVWQALTTVKGLQRGRSDAREVERVKPVAEDDARATLPYLRPQVRGMVELQLLTGMRPGEVCGIRPCDIDTSRAVWEYRPPQHKLSYLEKDRVICIGPRAQSILKRFTPADPMECYFSPVRAVEQLHAERSAVRKTPRYASHVARNAAKRAAAPRRKPAHQYGVSSYGQAIARAVERANEERARTAGPGGQFVPVPHWHPNQLRHSHATEVRRRYGLETAGASLGHDRMSATEVYAEKNLALARTVAAEMG